MNRLEALTDLADVVRENQTAIVNALRVYGFDMRDKAKVAREAHEAGIGTETPTPAPGRVSVAITNNGYRMAAEMAEQSADKALTLADKIEFSIEMLLDADDE